MLTENFLQTRSAGKARRLRRLFDEVSRCSLIVPIDDSLISGPIAGLENLDTKIGQIAEARPNGIISFPGAAASNVMRNTPIPVIINLTTSTRLSAHTRKTLSFSVEHAVRLGADAVAVHVNLTSAYESEMLKSLSQVIMAGEEFGIPVMGIMYPRREDGDKDENYESLRNDHPKAYSALVAHACRVGMEMGVDLLKTQYAEPFETVVTAAQDVPVLIAGGPLVEQQQVLSRTTKALQAGASGVSYGRNTFSRTNSTEFLLALRAVLHTKANSHP